MGHQDTIQFEDAPLHDAVLEEIRINWPAQSCEISMRAFFDLSRDAEPCLLRFRGLRNIVVPSRAPWGNSVCINGQRCAPDGRYLVELQSGDVIEVEAEGVEVLRSEPISAPAGRD